MRNILLSFAAGFLSICAFAQENVPAPQIVNVLSRQNMSLDGQWKAIVDPFENGYYDYRRRPAADAQTREMV